MFHLLRKIGANCLKYLYKSISDRTGNTDASCSFKIQSKFSRKQSYIIAMFARFKPDSTVSQEPQPQESKMVKNKIFVYL